MSEAIYILAAKRTPFGAYLGSLAHISATDLGVYAAKSALKNSTILPDQIDHIIFGNVLQSSKDAIYLARHIGLKCEIPHTKPALNVNRLCGSGVEALIQGVRLIKTQEARCVLVGGSENMSQAPHVLRGARRGLALGQAPLEDSLWESLNDTYINMTMAMTAENLAEQFKISQEEVDDFCILSQENYQKALRLALFADEIEAISCGSAKKPVILQHDEHPRADTNKGALAKLPKIFKSDGLIHAAAASGICDGAAALVVASGSFCKANNLRPLAEFISFGISGCDPKFMGLGPVDATKICLRNAHIGLDDLEMIEINEAFAPQTLAVKKALAINPHKLNIHGGALALGHPLAASGARLCAHLVHSLKFKPKALGLASACIGGGQGIAVILKSC